MKGISEEQFNEPLYGGLQPDRVTSVDKYVRKRKRLSDILTKPLTDLCFVAIVEGLGASNMRTSPE